MPWLEDLKFPRGYQMGTHKRKYNSDFSKEMTNSVQKYIDQFKSEAD